MRGHLAQVTRMKNPDCMAWCKQSRYGPSEKERLDWTIDYDKRFSKGTTDWNMTPSICKQLQARSPQHPSHRILSSRPHLLCFQNSQLTIPSWYCIRWPHHRSWMISLIPKVVGHRVPERGVLLLIRKWLPQNLEITSSYRLSTFMQ